MSSNRTPTKKRVTKDEKIASLKSELKVSKEENARLKREIEVLRQGGPSGSSNSNPSSKQADQPQKYTREEEQKKFREAMRAFKKVTVKQEMCIKTYRTKAKQRRKDIKQRDLQIKTLEQKVKSLETASKTIRGDKDLHSTIKDMQVKYDQLQQRKDDLEQILDQKESQLDSLRQQTPKTSSTLLDPLKRKNGDNPSDGESTGGSVGSGSILSVSTESDFNVARLKTELARKSEKILSLQMDLETVKDQLYQVKQQQPKKSGSADLFVSGNPFFSQQQQQQQADDWTDVDDTDNESEFGEGFFPNDNDFETRDKGDPFFQKKDFDAGFW